jgi:hypothetical protein
LNIKKCVLIPAVAGRDSYGGSNSKRETMTAILLLLGIIIMGYCLFNMTFNGLLILGFALFFWGLYRVLKEDKE